MSHQAHPAQQSFPWNGRVWILKDNGGVKFVSDKPPEQPAGYIIDHVYDARGPHSIFVRETPFSVDFNSWHRQRLSEGFVFDTPEDLGALKAKFS